MAESRGRWPIPLGLAALGIVALATDLGGVLWKTPLGPTGVTAGDWIDALATFVVIALYASIASGLAARARRPVPSILYVVATAYAMGRGIHLAANSIHDMIDHTGGADPWGLVYLWDEHVSHYMVDAARISFAVVLVSIEGRSAAVAGNERTAGGRAGWAALLVGAVAYGFIYFASAVEGQTVPLALPYSLAFGVWGIGGGGRVSVYGPARAFFTVAALTSLFFFAVWGIWKHGFPEFSRTGFIG
jgi:hypothetical protein